MAASLPRQHTHILRLDTPTPPRYIPRGPNFGPRPRSTRWPKRVPRCRALLGGFSRARRIGPSGLRGDARGRCRPRRERIAPTATPRPTPRRRKSATRCGSPCQCSPCCRRCFSTLPKNVRRQDHGAERRALNSISNQIDLRKIHWLANPGKVIRGALLYAVGLGWSACGETLRPARRPDRGHRVAATQRTKRVAPPGRAARHDARRARRRRRPVCCMGGDRGRAARLRGRAPRPRRRACSNARAADAARPHECMSRRSIRLGMSHRPINALDRNAVRDVIGQPEWGIFASVCSVSIIATLTKLDNSVHRFTYAQAANRQHDSKV